MMFALGETIVLCRCYLVSLFHKARHNLTGNGFLWGAQEKWILLPLLKSDIHGVPIFTSLRANGVYPFD